jgi:hypothetical protein
VAEPGPKNLWWTTALYAVVIALATFFTIKLSPYQAAGNSTAQHSNQSPSQSDA